MHRDNESEQSVVQLLERLEYKDAADYAESVAKLYEPIERAYSAATTGPSPSRLAASANRQL